MLWYASIGTELLPVAPKRRKSGEARYRVMSRSRRGMDNLVSKVSGVPAVTKLRVIRGGPTNEVPTGPVRSRETARSNRALCLLASDFNAQPPLWRRGTLLPFARLRPAGRWSFAGTSAGKQFQKRLVP